MEIKRKTEIFVETNRRFVIHQAETAEQVFCPQCAEPMITAEQAAAFFRTGRRDIYRSIENDMTHFAETETGVMFVCPASLANIYQIKNIEPGERL